MEAQHKKCAGTRRMNWKGSELPSIYPSIPFFHSCVLGNKLPAGCWICMNLTLWHNRKIHAKQNTHTHTLWIILFTRRRNPLQMNIWRDNDPPWDERGRYRAQGLNKLAWKSRSSHLLPSTLPSSLPPLSLRALFPSSEKTFGNRKVRLIIGEHN